MNESQPRQPRILLKVGLALGVVLLSLGAVEGALRVAGFRYHLYPERIRFGYPEPEKIAEGYFIPHDRFLWVSQHYAERPAKAQEDTPDLILMGCSCTEWGEFDTVITHVSEKAGHPLKVANFATAGWSTYQGLNQMMDDVVPIAPKVVTIYYGWNDHWMGFGIEDKTVAELTASPIKKALQESRLVQWVSKVIVNRKAAQERTLGEGAFPERVSLADFRSNLEGQWLQDLSQLVPLHKAYVDTVRAVAAEREVVLCDLVAQFEALPPDLVQKYMKQDGIHLTTDFGGRVVGRMIYQTLMDHGLL
jgi:hypothetical protein